MNRLQIMCMRRDDRPDVSVKEFVEACPEGFFPGVPAASHVEDSPEKNRGGVMALVWVLLPQDWKIGVEALEIPSSCQHHHSTLDNGKGSHFWKYQSMSSPDISLPFRTLGVVGPGF